MKLGIIGLPQTGKKTLFQLITGHTITEHDLKKNIAGTASIRDIRFDKLVDLYQPKKEAPARIEFELLPTIENNSINIICCTK